MTPKEAAEWLDKRAYFSGGEPRYGASAELIRAQAEALKIATEALEFYGNNDPKNVGTGVAIAAFGALARIKELSS